MKFEIWILEIWLLMQPPKPEAEKEKEVEIVYKYEPPVSKPWSSMGSEKDIESDRILTTRQKVTIASFAVYLGR